MEYIKYNHNNPGAYNNFVPDATKEADAKVINIIFLVTALSVLTWFIMKNDKLKKIQIKSTNEDNHTKN